MNHQWQPISAIMYDLTEHDDSSSIVGGGTTEISEDELIQEIFKEGLFSDDVS